MEVIGPPGDSGLVSQTLPLAETAAAYDLTLIRHVNPHDIDQAGFVVFVSGSASDRNRWFESGPQPKEQTGDAGGGVTHLLNGPVADCGLDNMTSACGQDYSRASGSARIVITPYQQAGETPQQETSVLVRDMIQAMYIPAQYVGLANGSNVPAWANEGIARVIADLYQADGNPAPASYDFGQVITAVRALPSSYRHGPLPDARQLHGGTTASRADWDAVAASVYTYIEEKYGMSKMLASAVLLGLATDSGWRKWLQDPS